MMQLRRLPQNPITKKTTALITKKLYRTLILTAIAVWAIHQTQIVVMPIIFSALCAMLLHPLVKRFEKMGFKLIFASLIAVLLFYIVLLGSFGYMAYKGIDILSTIPTENVEDYLKKPIATIQNNISIDLTPIIGSPDGVIKKSKDMIFSVVPETLEAMNYSFTFLLSCPVFIFFMLISRSQVRRFYYTSFKPEKRAIANRILQQIELVYLDYVRGLFLVMLFVSALSGLGFFLLGLKYPFFLGLLSGLLTLLPYVGVFISGLIPVLLALMTKDSVWYSIGAIGVVAGVQFLEGNVITPRVMEKQVGVNPMVIVVGLVIFGAIGGLIGMILTIPVLVLLKTISFYLPGWKPLRSLLQSKN